MKGRVCAICGKPGGTPLSFKLKWMGVKGDYAHLQCVQKLTAAYTATLQGMLKKKKP